MAGIVAMRRPRIFLWFIWADLTGGFTSEACLQEIVRRRAAPTFKLAASIKLI